MIGQTKTKILSNYKGSPCYELKETAVNIAGCNGCIGAANTGNYPDCASLRALDIATGSREINNMSAKFDPVAWIKANPLYAGAAAIAAYLLFFKK